MARIGLIGLGRMGSGMAACLLAAGHDLTVWNRSSGKCQPLVARGAVLAASPAEAARGADAVFAMVADDAAFRQVWLSEGGALGAMRPGSTVIECSTLSLSWVIELSATAGASGLVYIDCPVTGLPEAAASGQLTLLVGASLDELAKARPLLEPLAKSIRHFGDVGAGTGYKLINNLLGAVHIAALAEAVVLGERMGLDRAAMIAALQSGAVASPQVVRFSRPMVERSFATNPSFTVGLRHKDALYALAAAHPLGVTMPIGSAAAAWFGIAEAVAFDADEATLVDAVARAATQR